MDFLKEDVRKLYIKFLSASVFSALVVSIYAFVDTIAIGQSEGPLGTAAISVITPLYGLYAFFSLLCGIGGAVQMSKAKGEGREEKGNAYFTSALLLMAGLTVLIWILMMFFHRPIFAFFGAEEALMPKVMLYAKWMIFCFPAFVTPTFLAAFIRNDGAPGLVMAAVIIGGCVNMFGDWFFVFPLGMGMEGAAIATVIGTHVQILVMSSHFLSKRCHLKLVRPHELPKAMRNILNVGVGAGVIELGSVVIAIMMNNQIMRYGGTTELAVYGVLVTIVQLFSAMFSGVGQAIQPLVSTNFGAGNHQRNRAFLRMAVGTVLLFGAVFTLVGEVAPVQITKLFIAATPEVLLVAPGIVRRFFWLFLPSGISVLAIYYLQSTMCHKQSMLLSLLKGVVVSGGFLLALPPVLEMDGVWIAQPCSELVVAVIALWMLRRSQHRTKHLYESKM